MPSLRASLAVAAFFAAALVVADTPTPTLAPPDLSGNWCGDWLDTNSGHRGPLRAEFRKCGDQAYEVLFVGRFWRIFPFRYRVTLNVVGQEGDAVLLSGNQDLGFFGCFQYAARATQCSFVADFTSQKYAGQFRLAR